MCTARPTIGFAARPAIEAREAQEYGAGDRLHPIALQRQETSH